MGASRSWTLIQVGAFVAATACSLWSAAAAAQIAAPAPFTKDQADSGREDYKTSCASCHGDHLSGKLAPGLTGATFNASWAKHTTKELYEFVQSTMPACDAGALPSKAYINIIAFILQENGAKAGADALSPQTSVKISDVINSSGNSATPNSK
jgi:mono/diheme cytochrome c family protein